MIFFCFSSKDRHEIVEAILFHITNYDFPVWYDRFKMLMGDNRNYKNFDEGVGRCNYAIIIVSPNSIQSTYALEEMELIHERNKAGEMTVFPIFYNIKAGDLPADLLWMTTLVYKELDAGMDARSACNHVMCKILLDELEKYSIKSIDQFINQYENVSAWSYILQILTSYRRISDDNRDARIALLYSICMYIRGRYNLSGVPQYYFTGVERLFDETRLHLPVDLREMLIFERLTLLLLNAILFGYIA